jgi:hypothetical protein
MNIVLVIDIDGDDFPAPGLWSPLPPPLPSKVDNRVHFIG